MSDDAGVDPDAVVEGAADAAAVTEPVEAPTAEAAETTGMTAAAIGLTAKAVLRLTDALPGWSITDDATMPSLSLAVISSRTDPDAAQTALAQFRDHCDGPVVVVTHPGGEAITVDLLAAGASLAVPEGRENRIASLFADASLANDLVEAYVTYAGSSAARFQALEMDEHAGIAGALAFEDALAETATAGAPPRVVILSARDLDVALRGMNTGIANLLRRRIAQQIQNALRPVGATVYALDTVTFATLVPDDDGIIEQIVEPLRMSIESYAPVRGRSLRLALGHAGIDDAADAHVMRDLAERACAIAVETGRRVVSASELVEAVADRTNLVTLLGAIEAIESVRPELRGHAARVADLSVALAQSLGLDEDELRRIATAARFHDVGKLGLPAALLESSDALEGGELQEWRSHVDRGAQALTPAAGTVVATLVRHHHERFDGSGFPNALAGEAIPLGARIIAVADAFDIALTRADSGEPLGMDGAVRQVIDQIGTAFDRSVVDALVDLVQRRRLPHSLTG